MSQQGGQVLIENLLLCAALLFALLIIPIQGRPAGLWLLQALGGYFRSQSFVLSIL